MREIDDNGSVLKVGDRVRVRLRPECPYYTSFPVEGVRSFHPLETNGARGIITRIWPSEHGILVDYENHIRIADQSFWRALRSWMQGVYGSDELELLEVGRIKRRSHK